MVEWFPVVNTALLVIVIAATAARILMGRQELSMVEAVYAQNQDLLALLKVLITELRVRPCILPPEGVAYPSDMRPAAGPSKEA